MRGTNSVSLGRELCLGGGSGGGLWVLTSSPASPFSPGGPGSPGSPWGGQGCSCPSWTRTGPGAAAGPHPRARAPPPAGDSTSTHLISRWPRVPWPPGLPISSRGTLQRLERSRPSCPGAGPCPALLPHRAQVPGCRGPSPAPHLYPDPPEAPSPWHPWAQPCACRGGSSSGHQSLFHPLGSQMEAPRGDRPGSLRGWGALEDQPYLAAPLAPPAAQHARKVPATERCAPCQTQNPVSPFLTFLPTCSHQQPVYPYIVPSR